MGPRLAASEERVDVDVDEIDKEDRDGAARRNAAVIAPPRRPLYTDSTARS